MICLPNVRETLEICLPNAIKTKKGIAPFENYPQL